jgi:uncharacterized protein YqgC (DUF456 family)
VLVGLAILVGVAGVIVPVLPGALLVWGAIVFWAIVVREPEGWVVLAVATLAIGATQVLKYVLPGRRLQDAGVPLVSLGVGFVGAIVGFILVPVVGIFLGFPVGVFVGELVRLRDHRRALVSTRSALANMGLSILIELAGALVAGAAWLGVVIATA